MLFAGSLTQAFCQAGCKILRIRKYERSALPALEPIFSSNIKIWFNNDLAIEQIATVHINIDTLSRRAVKEEIRFYAFVNFKSQKVTFYKTFFESATILRRNLPIKTLEEEGGWNFRKRDTLKYEGSALARPDTNIDGKLYKKFEFNTTTKGSPARSDALFRCGATGRSFTIETCFSEKIGCSMVKLFTFPLSRYSPDSAEILDVSDKLDPAELRVFNAWYKNEMQENQ
jgi:hypothetical protein